jgi:hypothetical protein
MLGGREEREYTLRDMPLVLPPGSRFARGATAEPLPMAAVSEFEDLILRIGAQHDNWAILEHFKSYFAGVIGSAHFGSSDEGWAYTDLRSLTASAANSPALFLEAFYEACEALRQGGRYELPELQVMNAICKDHSVPFEIRPPKLISLGEPAARVARPEPPPTLAEAAAAVIRQSLQRAEELLAENRPREAVQEMLWILESIATTFRGTTLPTGTVQGRYFNEIARELRRAGRGSTLERVIAWCMALHSYLSSPTGGGIRHGLDLASGTPISPQEGRLFCNLILSYITYLMSEHETRSA